MELEQAPEPATGSSAITLLATRERALVLVVDDDRAVRQMLEVTLERAGYGVRAAEDGDVGAALALEIVPDLVLLDVDMPRKNGFDVCALLRGDPILRDVPVIMMTGDHGREQRLRGIKAGADEFLAKPFDTAELLARVRTITTLNRQRRLLAARAAFDWVVETAESGYLLLSADAVVEYANVRARQFLGIGDEAIGRDSFPECALARFRLEPGANANEDGAMLLVLPETGSTPPAWVRAETVTIPCGSRRRLVRLADVTEEVSARRDAWKFHSAIHHKLRTPLTAVVGGIEMLQSFADDLSDAERQELCDAVRDGARRLAESVDSVLAFAAAPSSARRDEPVWLEDVPLAVAEAVAEVGIQSVAVEVDRSVETARLNISAPALSSILRELIANAKKFHPTSSPAVQITLRTDGMRAVVEVADDGVSLTPAQLASAWKLYFQGERFFTGEVRGLGLGLPMVAATVLECGGDYAIRNRAGGSGVVVELAIPLQRR